MKASIKFRDDQKPLLRAKVPIGILGLPFVAGVSTGDTKELRLDLATSFESGPSFRVSYKPNDPSTPFSLVVKTGIGSYGSPAGAPFAMSAEFNLVGRSNIGSSPAFLILLKPRFGDFVLKKSVKSTSVDSMVKKIGIDKEVNIQDSTTNGLGTAPPAFRPFETVNGFSSEVAMSTKGGIDRLLSGVQMNARSVLPILNRANVNFRWGLRVPAELNHNMSISKMPLLVMNKLSIEHVACNAKEVEKKEKKSDADVANGFLAVKPEFEALRTESGLLRRAVDDLRADVSGWKITSVASPVADVSRGGPQPPVAGKREIRRNIGKFPEGSEEAKLPGIK